ncbi:hypothetical protein CRG98_044097, partial [Punica granatum]
ESKLARLSKPGKVARGTSEVARRTCGAGKCARTGYQTQQSFKRRARWLPNLRCRKTRQGCKWHERGGSVNLRYPNVSSHGLADRARFQVARARWLGKLAVQERKLARVSRPGKVARGTSETRQGCKWHERGGSVNLRYPNVSSHGLADRARFQVARARWLGKLAVQERKLARVSRPGKVARGTSETRQGCKWHERGGSVNLRYPNVSSHGLADRARFQVARARWLGKLAVQERKLARVSRPGKVARGTSETGQGFKWHERGGSANLRCKNVNSHGLADPARLQEARARWLSELAVQESSLGELKVQESKLARVSRPGKVASGTSEVAR